MTRIVMRGDTQRYFFRFWAREAGVRVPKNLAGCTVWLTVKPAASDDADDADAVLRHSIAIDDNGAPSSQAGFEVGGTDPVTGQVYTDAADGVLTHVISAAESAGLVPGDYVGDIQFRDAAGAIETLNAGEKWTVKADVTRRTTLP